MAESFIQKIKKGISEKRGVSFYFLAVSLVFSLAMLILYTRTGTNTFTPVLSNQVIVMVWGCVVLAAALCILEIKNIKYVLYLFSLWTWLTYLVFNASYISNVLVGIDGNLFSVGFLITAAFGMLAWVFALVSAIVQKQEIGSSPAAANKTRMEG